MMRPYYKLDDDDGDRQSGGVRYSIGSPLTKAARWIMLACVAVFVLQLVLKARNETVYKRFLELFAFVPAEAFRGYVWQFVTYVFLHDGFLHILLNLFFFWMVAGLVEGAIGAKRFLWLFFLSGAAGALAQGLIFPDAATIGASASVMGVAAACAVLYPDMRILFFFIIPMKMKVFLWVLVAFELLSVSAGQTARADNVARFAHLAGLAVGYVFMKFEPRLESLAQHAYYRLSGRFRGFVRRGKVTHIEDDEKYRQEVDRLLDKIFHEGTQSLTKEETQFLKEQSEKYKK